MRRPLMWLVLPLLVSCDPAMMSGDSYFGFSLDIRSAAQPPRVVFVDQPQIVLVPRTSVYVVENSDYDMFQCRDVWYVAYEGYWYRASSSDGPFVTVSARSVPREILTLPDERWKHHHPHGGPPGITKRYDREGR